MKFYLVIVLCLFSQFSIGKPLTEDKTLLSGKIEFISTINYTQAVENAKKLTQLEGLQSLWVRKMGPEVYGVSLILKYDGSKESKHSILQNLRKILGSTIQSWDLATGVTWIKSKEL